jgi:hypothetical protein
MGLVSYEFILGIIASSSSSSSSSSSGGRGCWVLELNGHWLSFSDAATASRGSKLDESK